MSTDKEQIERLHEQLTASQAREAKLRESLAQYRTAMVFTRQYVGHEVLPAISGWSWFDADEEAKEAISQSTDDTALREMIQKAGEVMRSRCAKCVELRQGTKFGSPLEDAIRSLPGITLEDLK